MPEGPFSPTATITTEARISVISVIPDTGLVPTMAIEMCIRDSYIVGCHQWQ